MSDRLKKILSCKNISVLSAPAVPFLFIPPDRALIQSQHSRDIGYAWPWIISCFINDQIYWIYDVGFVLKKSAALEKNLNLIEDDFKGWNNAVNDLMRFARQLQEKGITDVKKDYCMLLQVHELQWAYGIIPEYLRDFSDVIVKRVIDRHGNVPEIPDFLLPDEKSSAAEERLSMLRLVRLLKKTGKAKEFSDVVSRHQRQFYWMQTNYRQGETLPVEYFVNEAKRLAGEMSDEALQKELSELENYEKTVKRKKAEARRTTALSKKEQDALQMVAHSSVWQDGRKKAGLIGTHWLYQIAKKGAKQLKIPLDTLMYATPEEFLAMLDNKKVDLEEIRCRKQKCIFIRYSDATMEWLPKELYPKVDKIIAGQVKPGEEVKGVGVSKGSAKGRVRVVLDPARSTLQQGEILVTSMTRPEFVPLMRKAAAIVTDEGGITSHAAIISREMKKPCIIGTKIATKVLKDGDMVEVDADKGIVRKV